MTGVLLVEEEVSRLGKFKERGDSLERSLKKMDHDTKKQGQ